MRGRKWIKDKVAEKAIFITKADKGGATLVMNYADVEESIKQELMNNQKFEKLSVTADEHLSTVREKVNNVSKQLKQNEKISKYDKTMITGLTDNNRVKQAPEYRAVSPYTYPSFKIHKLTKEEITEKKIPPARLIHASKYGPLYRAEKWTSPHLTKRSRSYCEDEFVRDTNHLLSMIEEENNSGTFTNEGYNLFTLDVEKLYPSIQPNLAMEAINDLLDNSTEEDSHTADAVKEYIKLSFDESYMSHSKTKSTNRKSEYQQAVVYHDR